MDTEEDENDIKETEEERSERLLRESRARRDAIKQRFSASSTAAVAASAAAAAPASSLQPYTVPEAPSAAASAAAIAQLLPSVAASAASLPAAVDPFAAIDMFDWGRDDEEWVKCTAAEGEDDAAAGGWGGGGGGGGVGESSDTQGYFRPRIGEFLAGRYLVLGVLGKGAFSCVLYCKDTQAVAAPSGGEGAGGSSAPSSNAVALAAAAAAGQFSMQSAPTSRGDSGALVKTHAALPTGSTSHVALKVVNNREPMRKAGEREIEVLRTLATSDPEGKYHTVRLLHVTSHAGHLCLAFEPMAANLKEVQDKFGKGVGLPLGAVQVYAAQLLLALGLLGKLGYVHGDLKPHNIFASEGYRTLKLGDFGSAFRWETEPDADAPQPYVGSRFYRAPEAILGAKCNPAWDIWSTACLLFELYTGNPLFPGRDNNDMLWRVQCLRGPFPHRHLRKHCAQVAAVGTEAVELHFDPSSLAFRRRVADPVTKELSVKLVEVSAPSDSLGARLAASRAGGDSKKSLAAFQTLLESMLILDPARRCTVNEALGSAFILGKDT